MAFENKEIYDIIRILTLLLFALPFAASTNINCGGKSFHCVNSTHFMICVDLGGGVSSTIDGFVIPCPPTTECQATNRFECEFPSTTATNVVTSVSSAAEHSETTVSDSPLTITPYQVSDARILDNNIESTTRLQNNSNKDIPVTLHAEILITKSTKISEDITLQPHLQKQDDITNNKYTEIYELSKELNVTSENFTNQEAMITTATQIKEIEYANIPSIINLTKTDSLVPFVTLDEERIALDPLLNIDLLENSEKDINLTAGTTYDTTETQISTHKYQVTTESAIGTAITTKEHNSVDPFKTDVSWDSLLFNVSLGIVNDTKQNELMTSTTENLKIDFTNFEVTEPSLYNELSTEYLIATTSKAIKGVDMEVMQSTTSVNILKDDKTFNTMYTGTEISPPTPFNYNPSENIISTEKRSEKKITTTTVENIVNKEILNGFSTVSVNDIILENFVTTEQSLKNQETTEGIPITTSDTMNSTKLENIYLTSTAESMSTANLTFLDEIDRNTFTASLSNTEANRLMTKKPIKKSQLPTVISTGTSLQASNISNSVEMIEMVTSNSVKESVVSTQKDLQNEITKEKVVRTTLNVESTNKMDEMITATTTYSTPMDQDVLRTSTLSNYEADRTAATVVDPILNEVTTEISIASTLQINNNIDGEEIIEAVPSNSFERAKPDTHFTTDSLMVQRRLENAETTENFDKVTFNMEVSNIIEDVVDFAKDDTMLSITNIMKGSTSTILPNTETKIKVEKNKVTLEKIAFNRNESGRNVEFIDFIPSESLSTQPVNNFSTEKISTTFSRLENVSKVESITTPTLNLEHSNYMENIIHFTTIDDRRMDDMVNLIGKDEITNVSQTNAAFEIATNAIFIDLNIKNESTSETNNSAFSLNKTYISDAEVMPQLQNLKSATIFEDFTTADAISTQRIPENGASTTELTSTIFKTEQVNNKKVIVPLMSDYISTTGNIIFTTDAGKQNITTVAENMQLAADTISQKVKVPEKNINSPTAILNTNKQNDFEIIPNITSTSNTVTIYMALAVLNTTKPDEIEMFNNSNMLPHILKGNSMTQVTTESLTTKSTSTYNNDFSEKFATEGNNSATELNIGILSDGQTEKLKIYNGSNNIPDDLTATERSFMPRKITTPGINDKIKMTVTESSTISSMDELIPMIEGLTLTTNGLNFNTIKNMDYNIHDNAITKPTTFDTQITTDSYLPERTLSHAVDWDKKPKMYIIETKKDGKSKDSPGENGIVNGPTRTSTQDTISSDISDGLNKNLFDIIRMGTVTIKPKKQLIVEQITRSDFVSQSSDLNKIETTKLLPVTEESLMKIGKDRNIYTEKVASNQNLKTTTTNTNMQLSKNINKQQNLNIPIEISEVIGNRDENNQTQNLEDITKSFNIKKQESYENNYLVNNNNNSNATTILKEISQNHLHNNTPNILGANFDLSGSDVSMSQSVQKQASAQNTSDPNTEHYKVISNETYFQKKGDLNSRVKSETQISEINGVYQSMIQKDEIKDSRQRQSNSIIRDTYLKNVSKEIVLQDQGIQTLESFQNNKLIIVEQDLTDSNNVTYSTLNNKVFTKPSAANPIKLESEQYVDSQLDQHAETSKTLVVMQQDLQENFTTLNNVKTPKEAKINLNISNLEILAVQTNTQNKSNDFKEFNHTKLGINVNSYEPHTSVSLKQKNKVENVTLSIINSLVTNEAGKRDSSPKPETSFHSMEISAKPNNKLKTGSEKEVNDTQVNETISVASTRDLTNKSEYLTIPSSKFMPYSPVLNKVIVTTPISTKRITDNYNTTVNPYLVHNRQDMQNGILATNDTQTSSTKAFGEETLQKLEITPTPENLSTVKSEKEKVYLSEVVQFQLEAAITRSPLADKDSLLIDESSVDIMKEHEDQIYKIKNDTRMKNFGEQIQVDKDLINTLGTSDQEGTPMSDFSLNLFDGTPSSVSLQNLKTDKIVIVTEVAKPISSDTPMTNKTQDMIESLSKNVSGSNQNIDGSQATYDAKTGGLTEKEVPEYAKINDKNITVITKKINNVASIPEPVNKNNVERNKEIHLTEKYTHKLIVPSAITTTMVLSTNIEIKDNISKIIPNVVNKSNTERHEVQNTNPHVYRKFDTNEQLHVASASYSEDTVSERNVKYNKNNETIQIKEKDTSTSQNESEGHIKKSQEYNNNSENSIKFYCRHKNRGRYADREDCQKFYICIGREEPIVGRCPQNTVFSDVRKQCTKNLSHCTSQSEFRCMAQGRFSDILVDNIYYICVSNGNHFIRFKFQCHKGYFLNKTSVKCYRQSESESNLQTSRKSSEYSSKSERSERREESKKDKNKSKEKHKRNDENKSVHFDCESEGKFAHPNDCRKYYVCTTNKKSEFRRKRKKCDSDEVFHKDKKECVDADSYDC